MMKTNTIYSLLAISLLVSACSNRADTDPKAVITEKAKARWDARIAGEKDKLYDYLSPSNKSLITKESYISKFRNNVLYKNGEVKSIECDNENDIQQTELCNVTIDVTYEFRGMQAAGPLTNTRPVKEKWIKEEGDWWLYDN